MSSDPQSFLRSWIIGRSPECDLVVAESTVSGRHCRLSWDGLQFFVEDLHAPNGVYLAGVRISPG
ncbi:MAG TPA: FHA domain-containing protein, partial [Acidobacteriaceae bacterium]|nr:FHA domain-containing protein [Acidobacteriaceae bacterium]